MGLAYLFGVSGLALGRASLPEGRPGAANFKPRRRVSFAGRGRNYHAQYKGIKRN
jgi:hypothetical protein